jgi:hypothetical protein
VCNINSKFNASRYLHTTPAFFCSILPFSYLLIWTGFWPSTSVFPCQYHSTNAPYAFIHLPPTLYNVFLPVLQFSPLSIIPPILHTHSFIYHRRCVMFFSQYFGFSLSISFYQCSVLYQRYKRAKLGNLTKSDAVWTL